MPEDRPIKKQCKVCGKTLRKFIPLCFDHLDLMAKKFSKWMTPEPPEPVEGDDYWIEHEYDVTFWGSGYASVWAHEDEIHNRADDVFSRDIEWDDIDVIERRKTARTRMMTYDDPPVEFNEEQWQKEKMEEGHARVMGTNLKLDVNTEC